MRAKKNIIGEKIGRLTIVSENESRVSIGGNVRRMFTCLCNCGKTVVREYSHLFDKRSSIKSCGCYLNDLNPNKVHGMTGQRMFNIWRGMKGRCTNPNIKAYKNYGGRGVTVCKRWSLFQNFYEDMKDGYKPNLTLDRYPNTNGDYELSNCRWIGYVGQGRNKRNNRKIQVFDFFKCISEYSEALGYKKGLIGCRIYRGWREVDAILGLDDQEKTHNYNRLKLFFKTQ